MKNVLHIRDLIDIVPMLPVQTPVMLRGRTGCGKSRVVRKLAKLYAKKLGVESIPVIDRRLGQMQGGDIIGLPKLDEETTKFMTVDWFKMACDQPCFLFLDELNRATIEIMQAAFQIVLDRELNGKRLHELTRVFTAINVGAEYTVTEMDPAMLDRFWVADLDPDIDDWLEWARSDDGNIHSNMIDFISATRHTRTAHESTRRGNKGSDMSSPAASNGWLDPIPGIDVGDKQPSRRSWEALNKALVDANLMDNAASSAFYMIASGYVGVEAAVAFREYVKNITKHVTPEQVLNDYANVQSSVKKMTVPAQNALIEKLSTHVDKYCKDALSDEQGHNLRDFMCDLPEEARLALWTKITKAGLDNLPFIKSVHKHCVSVVLSVFGVPPGPDGAGVKPKIPTLITRQR